jgi:hypothetical protein
MCEAVRSLVGLILVVIVSLMALLVLICASAVIPGFLTQFRGPITIK